MQKTNKRAGYIYQKISHKKEVRIAEVFWGRGQHSVLTGL